ncbi:MAG: ClbS/DfsB family four-helix bundle protein [Anaerolineales bacterium]|nr:ClbS/DfsB family four-helix bundle protein [Anaerolineales bacterium]
MNRKDRQTLLAEMDAARCKVEDLIPQLEGYRDKQIYPGWTIKEFLAHQTGWDDLVITFLTAYRLGTLPTIPAYREIDEYNAETVSTRQSLDYAHTLGEWKQTRQEVKRILQELPAEMFEQAYVMPWGGKGTIGDLLSVFVHHDGVHAAQLQEWLKNPDHPLGH